MEIPKKVLHKGFTLIELIVSMAILLVLFALTSINLTRIPSASNHAASFLNLLSDVRYQQTLAMSGSTGNSEESQNFGIRFEPDGYILFTGAVYNPSDNSNFAISLDPPLTLTNITFPDGVVVFSGGSGEILNYTNGSDSVSLTNSLTSEVKELRLNKNGATY
jgi:prepilin-type N-terminal cleavage/methylation domain-containing protein